MKAAAVVIILLISLYIQAITGGEYDRKGNEGIMQKMNLPLRQFLTLIGPGQKIKVVSEDSETLFKGTNAKIRDKEELHDREVKHIQPGADVENAGKYVFTIWVY